jgi:RNA polymerase sigma-70 factor (ECF subfamily)
LARYRPRLLRIVRVKLGESMRPRLDEEDIVQEVLLIAAERIAEFELRSHAGLLQWLTRIAENVLRRKREHHEADKRNPHREVRIHRSDSETEIPIATSSTTPSQQASRAELEALVDAHVEALEPAEYREVILLRDYYQEEWEAIRRSLGRPTLGAAQELYRRAHQRLAERLRRHLRRS